MYCRNCGTELREGQKFCPKCGTPVPGTTETAGPGTPSGPDKVNGNSVGQQGSRENINTDASSSEATPPQKNNTRMIIAIAAAVVVVAVVIIAVVVTRSGGSAEQAAEEPEAVKEEAASVEEEKEPELTEEEERELESQELADNIVLDLTISEGYSHQTIRDSIRDNTLDLILVSGTITNNNDENCEFVLQYDMEVTTLDNYGDEQTESNDIYSDRIYIAANDTIPFNQYICSVHGGYAGLNGTFSEDRADEDTTYACKGVTIDKDETEVADMPTGGMLPVSAVSDIQLSFDDERDDAVVTFTVVNDTDDRWKGVDIGFDIYLEGEYITDGTCSADYIKPGESAKASETFYNASDWGFESVYGEEDKYDGVSFNNAVEIVVTSVSYSIDTEYSD